MNSVSNPTKMLRIAIAEDHSDMLSFYESILQSMGHVVVGSAQDGAQLVELCKRTKPDLVIADIAMPVMDGIEAADRICQHDPVAIVLVSAHYDKRLIQRAQLEYVMAYLVKPITEIDLEAAIAMATMRFEQFQTLREEAHSPHQAMSDRRIIEKAKELIMQVTGLAEDDAFRRLQKMAWQQKKRMADVAQLMVSTSLIGVQGGAATGREQSELLGVALTDSEETILRLVASGLSNKEIAEQTKSNQETVATQRTTAMQKLGLGSRTELVRYAESQKWM
jgi:response regulator NasT